jgi:hypothetical protein
MASIHQIRGSLLEEIVLLLLIRSGYRKVLLGEEGTRKGPAGLAVEGRGTVHQIDALVTPAHSHAFIYPIRLLVEAKCEARRLGLATVRSAVGAIFDINQNFFAGRLADGRELRVQRFNYHAAMFAANGYSEDAEQYALAHQVFLIDYSHVASMRPVVDALLTLEIDDFGELGRRGGRRNLTRMREGFRTVLDNEQVALEDELFSPGGVAKINGTLLPAVRNLRGSYIGMIEGLYPVHLISRQQIPIDRIRNQPEIDCEIRVSDDDRTWAFEPSGIPENSPNFFHLEFTIPEFIADVLKTRTQNRRGNIPYWQQIANVKREHMRFINVTTFTEGQLLAFRLNLDIEWLDRYVRTRRARDTRRQRPRAQMVLPAPTR